MTKTTWLLLGGSAALLVAGAVYINLPVEPNPAPGGRVANLVVLNGNFERWYVARVSNAQVDGTTLTFTYFTGRCEKDGLVGYARDPTLTSTRLAVVAGESGKDCDSIATAHHAELTLDESLDHRQLVVVRPVKHG